MDVTVVVATFGGAEWTELAQSRAIPSGALQAPVVYEHGETLATARNAGAERATSEWLCFLDADDELAPGYMSAMAAADGDLRAPAVTYVRNGRPGTPKVWPAMPLTEGNYLVIGSLVRREMFLAVGGFREYSLYEDWDLWQRCWLAGAEIVQVPDAVYIAHVRPQSRNRAPTHAEQTAMHHEIRRANFPELYEAEAAA